ncbi:MAG: E3 binding domain-containing protein, partial [Propionivibrio sp.]
MRQFARELGVDLTKVPASGPKGRILKEDVTAYVKGVMQAGPAIAAAPGLGGGLDLL